MTETYKPGTVATATVKGRPGELVFRNGGGWWSLAKKGPAGETLAFDENVTDVRPLVTVDLNVSGPLTAENVVKALREGGTHGCRMVADQIEAQTKPPKPAEPTGLGAVVEDSKGVRWIRTGELGYPGADDWKYTGPLRGDRGAVNSWTTYSRIDAVKVLSQGVQA